MICQTCGATPPTGANFCPSCGAALGAAGDPRQALLEATRLIAADAGRDLDATLDTLTSQARRLLAADTATLQLATGNGDELEVRRPNRLVRPGSLFAAPGTRFQPGCFTREAMARRQPLFTADYQRDPRHAKHGPEFDAVVAAMVVPLYAGDQLVGTIYIDWLRPVEIGRREIEIADAFGQHAAIAIRTARLLEEAQRARAEAEAVLDAADDGIAVFGADGELLRMNRRARQDCLTFFGRAPLSLRDFRELAQPTDEEGQPLVELPSERAIRGRESVAVELVRSADGRWCRVFERAAPVREPDGTIRAVVVLWRDITELYDGIIEHARLEGAVKTARRVTHELNNQLALAVGYGELLTTMLAGGGAEPAWLAGKMHLGALQAARTVNRLGRIIRFEESEFGGQVMLDLDRATTPRN
ncbi:MAG TPA: GAF domain-containing protein [Chloroflexota bacterium]